MTSYNAFYGQSGGVTAVINATAAAVIATAKKHPRHIKKVYAGLNGIVGALNEDLIDIKQEDKQLIASLIHTPAAAFGSCRYQLREQDYERLLHVFSAHDIRYFFYNGGGDSQDTTLKLAQAAQAHGYPLTCIGIPKTIDNDLPLTDNSPGFGSAAKHVAISALEASYDIASTCNTSTKVFVMEVMGRHTGWLAASTCLAQDGRGLGPNLILLPEVPFDTPQFLHQVERVVAQKGFCMIVAAEGIKTLDGHFLSENTSRDAFGHTQLGGVAPRLAALVRQNLSIKCRWAAPDCLQRSARHIASQVDIDQAYAVGTAAVEYALQGMTAVMPAIVRDQAEPYQWHLEPVPLNKVANCEKRVPAEFIGSDGFSITAAGRAYLSPLIAGEAYPPYQHGLPIYGRLERTLVQKKLV